jgi:lipoate-protein ligase A
MGFPAKLWEESNHESANSYPRKDAFWCFDRRSDVDVVIGSRKVLGSAQRRSAIGLLQHGGLLMESSPWLPHLEGLFLKSGKERGDENRVDFHPKRLGDVVRLAIEDTLGCVWKDGKASEGVCARAKAIASERYSSPAWTQSKSR